MAPSSPLRPNILLVMFDQMAALSLPCYGHRVVRAPTMRALAAKGVVFEQAYCNAPLCSPSRHAMMTGRLPSVIGAYDNAAELPSAVPTFAHYLRSAGYRTCLSGKMDFTGADQLHGYEERLTTDLSPSDFGWTPNWDDPKRRYDWFHNLRSVIEAGPCDHSLTMDYDEEATHQASRWLHDAAAPGGDKRPFLLTVSYMHPHDPYLGPRPFWDRYAEADIDLPAISRIAPARRDPAARRLYDLYDRGEERVTERHLRAARRAYYAMIDYADEQLGRLLEVLRLTALDQRTIVVVTADHGDMLGERGLWYKMTFYERAMRVPLLMRGPGLAAGHRVTAPVSLVDILPTLTAIAGRGRPLPPALPLAGASLLPAARGCGLPPGEVQAEYTAEGTDQPMFMLRRGRWKYVAAAGDPPLLFDLSTDPWERRNLADERQLSAVASGFAAEVEVRWDAAEMRRRVVESQRARHLVHAALMSGRLNPWDYRPHVDADQAYFRNYGGPDPERRLRFPRAHAPRRARRGIGPA
jgi:choline-sulfatase